jgi:hypothetical protein
LGDILGFAKDEKWIAKQEYDILLPPYVGVLLNVKSPQGSSQPSWKAHHQQQ